MIPGFGEKIKTLLVLPAIVCLMIALVGCGLPSAVTPTAPGAGQNYPNKSAQAEVSPNPSVIKVRDLPPEGKTTLQLIERGGPFPYSQDGSVFNNFEGLLPERTAGFYREYTVTTPGSSDRGARRIIAGRGGEYYYTDDHYSSFKSIVE
jgi:ribonuclease T1